MSSGSGASWSPMRGFYGPSPSSRRSGSFQRDIKVKLSVWAGCANPAGAKLIESLGADTFNPVGDLTLPMLASIRSVVNIPMDVYIYFFESFGGSNRFWETPEIARIAPMLF